MWNNCAEKQQITRIKTIAQSIGLSAILYRLLLSLVIIEYVRSLNLAACLIKKFFTSESKI